MIIVNLMVSWFWKDLLVSWILQNEANQPDPNLTLTTNPTKLNPILDPEGQTQPQNRSGLVQIGFIEYDIGWTWICTLFELNPT